VEELLPAGADPMKFTFLELWFNVFSRETLEKRIEQRTVRKVFSLQRII
jgi:hypothetical protein